jgi:iron complex outermembrane receptor protein
LSTFFGFSQGYALPDIGTVIRNVSKPNQSMSTVVALDAIVTNNYDYGINWHTKTFSFGADVYLNRSPASTVVTTDPVTLIQTITRTPIQTEGIEFTGEWKITSELKLSGTYSKMTQYTAIAAGLPLNVSITPASTNGQEPDKAVLRLDYSPIRRLTFDLSGQNYWREELNVGRTTAQTAVGAFYRDSGYELIDGSVTYDTKLAGIVSLGCANIGNTYHILFQNPASATTYYSVQGRKFLISDRITF